MLMISNSCVFSNVVEVNSLTHSLDNVKQLSIVHFAELILLLNAREIMLLIPLLNDAWQNVQHNQCIF